MIRIKDTTFGYEDNFRCGCDCTGELHAMSLTDTTEDEIRDGIKRYFNYQCDHCLGHITIVMIVEIKDAICVDISNA